MKILKYRKEKKMTQGELANLSGATQQQIALIEKGAIDPRLSTLKKIASALQVNMGDLFFSEDEFVKTINQIIKTNLKDELFSLRDLNTYCGKFFISPFEECWEQVVIDKKNKKLKLKLKLKLKKDRR